MTLRVVLDTNVVLSALLFKSGRVSWLVPLCQQKRIVPLLSKAVANELLRVLAYPKFQLTGEDQRCVLQAFIPYVETVVTRGTRCLPRCRDVHDQKFLDLAAAGQAEFLVTGDDDLLSMEGFPHCPILTPESFRQMLSARGEWV